MVDEDDGRSSEGAGSSLARRRQHPIVRGLDVAGLETVVVVGFTATQRPILGGLIALVVSIVRRPGRIAVWLREIPSVFEAITDVVESFRLQWPKWWSDEPPARRPGARGEAVRSVRAVAETDPAGMPGADRQLATADVASPDSEQLNVA